MKLHANRAYVIKGVDPDKYATEIKTLDNGVVLTTVDMIDNYVRYGKNINNGSDIVTVSDLTNDDFNIDDLPLLMSLDDSEIYGYKPFIKILTTDMGNNVTSGIPNETYTTTTEATYDDEGNVETEATTTTSTNTWTSWINSNYTTTVVDDYTYFRSTAGTDLGDAMTGTELMLIVNDTTSDISLVDSIPTTDTETE